MSNVYTSRIANTNPLSRSAGLFVVVALHVAAILVINSGLRVAGFIGSTPVAHITPTFEKPQVVPIPVDPVTPNIPTTFVINNPVPADPVVETPATAPTQTTTSLPARPKVQDGGSEIIFARVDPTHPLTRPAYPAVSRRLDEQGRVELMLYILVNGKVGEARVIKSSGHARLDESAVREALRSWRFIPQQENGVATPSWQRFAITFRLEN